MTTQTAPDAAVAPGTGKNEGAAGPAAARQPAARAPAGGALRRHKGVLLVLALLVAGGLGYLTWRYMQPAKLPEGFASSNGRIEATEVDVAAKLPGRIIDELVDEGHYVSAGQVVAHMDTDKLQAERREAVAKNAAAKAAVQTARSSLAQRQSEKAANEAVVLQRRAELDLHARLYERGKEMLATRAISPEDFDTRTSNYYAAQAALATAKANVAASEAAIATARALIIAAEATVADTQATIERIQVDIDDSALKAPRSGRVQYRISQPGEVLPAGGKVLNLIDLGDVYMTFFLPTQWSGLVKQGADARLVLDAAPQFVIPAKVTYVADVAQFTPKTVETAEERQKLTFRVKAHIPPEVLQKYVRDVKTGLPGVAYVQLNPEAPWPAHLEVKLPQ